MRKTRLAGVLALALVSACTEQADRAGVESAPPLEAVLGYTSPTTYGYTPAELATLQDGRLLVAAGLTGELFDPATGAWTAAGQMAAYRFRHALVTLSDGRVLAAGGIVAASGQTAELFDPLTRTWTPTGALTRSRGNAASARLADGRVLLVGGTDASNVSIKDAELYDPATGTFGPTAGAPTASCTGGTATRLADGRVLTVCEGGGDLFDPATGSFTPVRSGAYRVDHVALLLPSGRVLVAGGSAATCELFDPATGQFSMTGSLPGWRQEAAAVVAPDGTVVLAGGSVGSTIGSAEVYRWRPDTDAWTAEPPLLVNRVGLAMAALPSNELLAVGGWTRDPFLNAWVAIGPPNVAEILRGTCPQVACPAGVSCGPALDGCGGTQDCGGCGEGLVCSSGACCAPTTCATQSASCGTIPSGCGGTLDCGGCAAGSICSANACVCVPKTCAALGVLCGPAADGCGGTLTCNGCPAGTTCDAVAATCRPLPGLAVWSPTLKVPTCTGEASSCDSGLLLVGRGRLGPEPGTPNTLGTCVDGASGTFHADESLDGLKVTTLDGTPLGGGKTVRIEATVWAYSGYSSDKLDLYLAPDAASPAWTLLATLTPTRAGSQVLSTTAVLPNAARQAIRGVFRYGGTAATCGTGSYDDRDDLVFDVAVRPDLAPPTVSLLAPLTGATIGGVATLSATASDDVGVTRVEFWVAANRAGELPVLIGTDTTAPYAVTWDTRTAPVAASHLFTARAYDAAGHVTVSWTNIAYIDNTGPGVAITAPAYGATVGGAVTFEATAEDFSGIAQVWFYADATLIGSVTAAPYRVTWYTAAVTAGSHTLKVTATDRLGNPTTISQPVVVTAAAPTGNALYSVTYRAPTCSTLGASCDSGTLLTGRAALGPEQSQPNTIGGTCVDGTSGTFHADESLDRLRVSSTDGSLLRAGGPGRVEATVWAWGTTDVLDVYTAASASSPTWVLAGSASATRSGTQVLTVPITVPAAGLTAVRGVFRYGGSAAPCPAGPYDDKDDLVFLAQ